MIKVSATELRAHLSGYLDRAAAGERVIVHRHHHEIARLVSAKSENWRDHMTVTLQLLVPPQELMKPAEEI